MLFDKDQASWGFLIIYNVVQKNTRNTQEININPKQNKQTIQYTWENAEFKIARNIAFYRDVSFEYHQAVVSFC